MLRKTSGVYALVKKSVNFLKLFFNIHEFLKTIFLPLEQLNSFNSDCSSEIVRNPCYNNLAAKIKK